MDQKFECIDIVSSTSVNDPSHFKFEMNEMNDNPENKLSSIPEISNPVLGTFAGVFAGVDSTSRNNRYYSRDFWEKVIYSDQVQDSLEKGSMIGIFEHPTVTEIYDKTGHPTVRHPQNGAYIVKSLSIEDNNIIGEAYLLNTPLGKILSTYFLARDKYDKPLVQLYVSARGYSPHTHIDRGVEIMDPKGYQLQSFDVVMNPGFLDAKVGMTSVSNESLDKDKELLLKLESATDEYMEHWRCRQDLIKTLNLHGIS